MKKIILIIFLLQSTIFVWSETESDIEFFEKYLHRYQTRISIGQALSYTGLSLSLGGFILASTSVSLLSSEMINQNDSDMLNVGAYSVVGGGLLFLMVGLPLWIHGLSEYYQVLEKRNIYFLMTR